MKFKFKTGDKIVIPDGYKLQNFKGNYSDTYTVLSCYYDRLHGVEWVEFYVGHAKYTYPVQAFDLVGDKND